MGKAKPHNPVRTCVSCGSKHEQRALIRMVLDSENRLIRDEERKRQTRGAYVCRTRECLGRLRKMKRLNRYFRTEKPVVISADFWEI